LVSIHINSITQGGVTFEIAATETYYTDETPWGVSATRRLAQLVQDEVVASLGPVASYVRQDRGISATNLYIVAPPLFVTTPDRPDPIKQPTRGALMPAILTEVGSISLAAEQDLLLSPAGQTAAAQGIADGIAAYLADRPLAVRYDALIRGGLAGTTPQPLGDTGPPFWAPGLSNAIGSVPVTVRLTNVGSESWPSGLRLLGAWQQSTDPYLREAPAGLADLGVVIPPLAPGESVELLVNLQVPRTDRGIEWLTLGRGGSPLSDLGSPPLQLSTTGP